MFIFILLNCSFESTNIQFIQKIFFQGKKEKYDYSKFKQKPWLHYLCLNQSLAKEVVRQNLFFSVLLTIIFFHNIRSNVPPDIAVKKIERAIAAAHFITQYQLNGIQQHYFLVQSIFFSLFKEQEKQFCFAASLSHVKLKQYISMALLSYLKTNFTIIPAHLNKKRW